MSTRIVQPAIAPASVAAPRLPYAYSALWSAALIAGDVAMFALSSLVAGKIGFVLFPHLRNPFVATRVAIAQGTYIVLWLLIFERLGLYKRSLALSMKDEFYYTCAALALGTVPQLLLFTLIPGISTSRAVVALSLPFSILFVGLYRAAAHELRSATRKPRRIAIVGKADRAAAAFASLDLSCGEDSMVLAVDHLDELEAWDVERCDWFAEVCRWGCESLIMTEVPPPDAMTRVLDSASRHHVEVSFALPRVQCRSYTMTLRTTGEQLLMVPAPLRACTPRAALYKRIFDVFFALVALVMFAPAMAFAAAVVFLDSGTPVIFRQERVGLRGRTFGMFKFRSMKQDAEKQSGPVWASVRDLRRTRSGKLLRRLSLDELPQLFNVLRGDMSLVGPRPERPVFVEEFRKAIPRYDERHLVRPGITGWSQVHMKRLLAPSDAAEKLKYDLQYIESWSAFLDVSVLFQTILEFLFHRAG